MRMSRDPEGRRCRLLRSAGARVALACPPPALLRVVPQERTLGCRPFEQVPAIERDAFGVALGDVVLLVRIGTQVEQPRAVVLGLVNELPMAVPDPELERTVVGVEARDARLGQEQRAPLSARRNL